MNKSVTLVAHDAAPSACFLRLKEALEREFIGFPVNLLVGNGRPIHIDNESLEHLVCGSGLVLIGMSSSPEFAEVEVRAALLARRLAVPYGFYSDIPIAVNRARGGAWFAEVATEARFVVGMLPVQRTLTEHMFPKATLVNTGNPIRDEMAFPTRTRTNVREQLGILEHEMLILAPGGKFMAGNAFIWMLLAEAIRSIERTCVIAISPHPGDPTTRALDAATGKPLNLYAEIIPHAPHRSLYLTKEVMPTLDAVVGADLVVEFTGSASVAAAYQRIPVISILPDMWMRRYALESGEPLIETVEVGASIALSPLHLDARRLSGLIMRHLFDEATREIAAEQQRRAYPTPSSPTGALDALVTTIRSFVS